MSMHLDTVFCSKWLCMYICKACTVQYIIYEFSGKFLLLDV